MAQYGFSALFPSNAGGVCSMLDGNFYVSCSHEGNQDALGTTYASGGG